MGVSPLDLQTMYANMNNVARSVSHQQQGLVLAQQLQESKIIQQNAEKSRAVQKAADNEAKSTAINDEKNDSGSSFSRNKKRKKHEEESSASKNETEIRESYLGIHINIER